MSDINPNKPTHVVVKLARRKAFSLPNKNEIALPKKVIDTIFRLFKRNNFTELNRFGRILNCRSIEIERDSRIDRYIKNLLIKRDFKKIFYFDLIGYSISASFVVENIGVINRFLGERYSFPCQNYIREAGKIISKLYQYVVLNILAKNDDMKKFINEHDMNELDVDLIRFFIQKEYKCTHIGYDVIYALEYFDIKYITDNIKSLMRWNERKNYISLIESTQPSNILTKNRSHTQHRDNLLTHMLNVSGFLPQELLSYIDDNNLE